MWVLLLFLNHSGRILPATPVSHLSKAYQLATKITPLSAKSTGFIRIVMFTENGGENGVMQR
jgi:hypothetical protein